MNKLMNTLTCTIAICAVVATGTMVYREFGPKKPTGPPVVNRNPVDVKGWRKVAGEGQRFGVKDAPVVITQFSDFQCPYCRRLHGVLSRIEEKYAPKVSFVYRHLPLDRIHPHARAAAYASECVARHGRFREFHDVLYSRQDSIGKLGWGEFALRAGIAPRDTGGIAACMRESGVVARVVADSTAAIAVGARGTPTVLINNWLLPGTPTFEQVDSVIRRLLAPTRG